MSSYVKPQVLVFQEFTIVPTEITEPLRAHIAGPNAILHRYSVADEKRRNRLGSYDKDNDATYLYPERAAGSVVDKAYVKLFLDNALLKYYTKDAGDNTYGTVTAVAGKRNWVDTDDLYLVTNGGAYPRTAGVFYDRDVKLGDIARVRCAGDDCEEIVHESEIIGFASQTVASSVATPTVPVANQDAANDSNTSAADTGSYPVGGWGRQVAGVENKVYLALVDGSDYRGSVDGAVSETYTVTVVAGGDPVDDSGCSPVSFRVRSSSGLDDVLSVSSPNGWYDPGHTGAENILELGMRGLKIAFLNNGVGTPDAGNVFVVGQKWEINVVQDFVVPTLKLVASNGNLSDTALSGVYTGTKNDVYIVEVTRGGKVNGSDGNYPLVTVRTAKGQDFSGPHEVVAAASGADKSKAITIGTKGVKVAFSVVSDVVELCAGDQFYVAVTSSSSGYVNRLILRDDLPSEALSANSLSLDLCIRDNIQVSRNRIGFAPEVNYYLEDTQVVVKEGIVAYHPSWTNGGEEMALPVIGGDVYVEFREWVATLADQVNAISSVADIDNIPGQLDPENPLKWGVYKALANSNGTLVKYTAVANPDRYDDKGNLLNVNLDSWQDVLERIKGRDDIYNLVPLTFDREVQNLWAAHATGESNEYANNWKGVFVSLKAQTSVQVAGTGARVGGVLGTEVTGDVLATVSDDPDASGNQYTMLSVTTGNGHFIDNDVRPGDIVRYQYATDAFGDVQYSEYVVDVVMSQNSLRLVSGLDSAVPSAATQRVEIWHNRNRNEIADALAHDAGAFGNRRVCAVWPDQVGAGGVMMAGYYLAAALAGLASGVVPHQPLTNVEIAGFDDLSRSYAYFNETQLNRMAEAGVWIATEDRDGTPHSRHALTTDNLDLNRREEMIRRNVDSISYLFLRRLRPFIGRTNAQPKILNVLGFEARLIITFLKSNGYTPELGGQLTDATIATLQIHPLLKDRVEIVIDLVVPAPLNNIELHLVV
jgi:hypothetical protein